MAVDWHDGGVVAATGWLGPRAVLVPRPDRGPGLLPGRAARRAAAASRPSRRPPRHVPGGGHPPRSAARPACRCSGRPIPRAARARSGSRSGAGRDQPTRPRSSASWIARRSPPGAWRPGGRAVAAAGRSRRPGAAGLAELVEPLPLPQRAGRPGRPRRPLRRRRGRRRLTDGPRTRAAAAHPERQDFAMTGICRHVRATCRLPATEITSVKFIRKMVEVVLKFRPPRDENRVRWSTGEGDVTTRHTRRHPGTVPAHRAAPAAGEAHRVPGGGPLPPPRRPRRAGPGRRARSGRGGSPLRRVPRRPVRSLRRPTHPWRDPRRGPGRRLGAPLGAHAGPQARDRSSSGSPPSSVGCPTRRDGRSARA